MAVQGEGINQLVINKCLVLVGAHRLVTCLYKLLPPDRTPPYYYTESHSVVGRPHRRRCDILCVTVTHCDIISQGFRIYILEPFSKNVTNFDTFDDNCQKFLGWGEIPQVENSLLVDYC